MLSNAIFDLIMNFGKLCYSPDFNNLKGPFLKSLPDSLKTFEEYLGDKTWLTGENINYPDFSLCELLNQLEKFEPSCLSKFHKLKAYLTRFENLPELKEYMSSEEFKKRDCAFSSSACNSKTMLGQQIRLLLTYCGEKFDQEFYIAGPAPDFSREQWLSKKFNLGLDFPNLPYLIVGDLKLTHSTAILEYIADRNNMREFKKSGISPEERATLLMVNLAVMDIRNRFYGLTFGPDYEKNKVEYMKNLPTEIKSLSDYLGDKKFFSGEKVSSAAIPYL
ncbi:unnamed protein product [Rodentolepis nana]|uniref:glutathione transferase n=1 Tax=Rodentolepis nana TaxID=102285 RepID=A0A0R3TWF6_RODNA|nr:unnamed protein product [Rodentolepis nana]